MNEVSTKHVVKLWNQNDWLNIIRCMDVLMTSASVLKMKSNIFEYFDPENICIDNENK